MSSFLLSTEVTDSVSRASIYNICSSRNSHIYYISFDRPLTQIWRAANVSIYANAEREPTTLYMRKQGASRGAFFFFNARVLLRLWMRFARRAAAKVLIPFGAEQAARDVCVLVGVCVCVRAFLTWIRVTQEVKLDSYNFQMCGDVCLDWKWT